MRLYPESNIVIDSINLAMCRPYKDFGRGFYLTDIKEQAEKSIKLLRNLYMVCTSPNLCCQLQYCN